MDTNQMIKLIESILPYIKNHTSTRGYKIFAYGATMTAIFYLMALSSYHFQKEIAKYSFFTAVIFTILTGLGIIISWIFDLKDEWDMRWVMVVNEKGESGYPMNCKYAKKDNLRYRKMTKAEKQPYKDRIRKEKITDIHDPEMPIENFMRIRNEQEQQKKKENS